MLSNDQLAELFRDQETDRVERKASSTDGAKIKQAICAFANDYPNHRQPGVIFVGQNDDLSCSNLPIDARLLETLGGWRSDGNILPFPSMAVRRLNVDGCEVAAIIVEPSENPPVRFDGRTWIRVGPRRAVATAAEENRLIERRRWLALPEDARGLPDFTIGDLDMRRFEIEFLRLAFSPAILQENGRTPEEQLRALRFVDPQGRPTLAAMLTLGKDPREAAPGAYIQFLALNGDRLTDEIRDQREIGGAIGDQLRVMDELIDLHIERPAIIGDVRREHLSYPAIAIKQVVRNALLHRSYFYNNAPVRVTWYSDRVEISSPGGPFGGVTAQNFGQPGVTAYRNPTVAEAMKILGFAERFGVGLQIVSQSLADNGNPPVEYAVLEQFVHVTIRAHP